MANPNQEKLIKSIVGPIEVLLAANNAANNEQMMMEFASLKVSMNSILARMEAFDAQLQQGGKRPTRVGGKTPAAAAPNGQAPAADDGRERVKNALLFAKYKSRTDPAFRAAHYSEAILAKIKADPTVKKHPDGGDKWWSAAGNVLWKSLTDAQKKEMTARFTEWRNEITRVAMPDNLSADPGPAANREGGDICEADLLRDLVSAE